MGGFNARSKGAVIKALRSDPSAERDVETIEDLGGIAGGRRVEQEGVFLE